jgi:hypothetical protein
MAILKLERLDDRDGDPFTPAKHLHINADHIETWNAGKPGLTALRMASGDRWNVAIDADDLAAAIDPENACPDPPGQCGYYTHYLVYGGPDLTHAGFHAAAKLADEHGRSCRVYETGRVCPTCQRNEERVRA